MKGIQINNFFNNHISLNPKKNNAKPPNLFFDSTSPKPSASNPKTHQQQHDQIVSYDTLTPQMKIFKKQPPFSNRKKRTNTIDPTTTKSKQNRKSKQKKSKSLQKFTKTLSLDKCNQKDTEQQYEISKNFTKNSKKLKTNKIKHEINQSEGVRRSKSAIIKNNHSKAIQSRQMSKQFFKKEKKNIISAQSSFKDTARKQLKKQTQNLLKKKQQTQKVQCKTARVESTKIKSKKTKDKIISQLIKSTERQDKKSLKFLTERKVTPITASKSYLTSAKQSKPVSARERKPSKKLFDSKEKDHFKIQDQEQLYQNFEYFVAHSGDQEDSQVKQALQELQSALQGISSKKALAQELKKFTSKLKNISSKDNSSQNPSSSEQQSNNDAFKKIKDFKNNLVKKKLNQAKKSYQSKQSNKERQVSKKNSTKKLTSKKKKLQSTQKNVKKYSQEQPINQNSARMMEQDDSVKEISQPEMFKNANWDQSKYINSKNVSEFYQNTSKDHHQIQQNQVIQHEEDSSQVLDQRNKKYMEFLKSLELEAQQKSTQKNKEKQFKQIVEQTQKNQELISDINTYLNKNDDIFNKNYNSEKHNKNIAQINPLLQRQRIDHFQISSKQDTYEQSINNFSEDKNQQSQEYERTQDDKMNEIQQLKAFRQQSDQMMVKIGMKKPDNKKKNLQIQLNTMTNQSLIKPLSSPKFNQKYPHLVKSPKFSDIQITNILAAKQKCLASKHQKMNELVQRMYEKQLVSPKSYEYYVYQLKKQYQDESQGIDGFKEQASQILNQINKEKNDIKAIDELIRQQKWQEARKLMKGQHKTPSIFFGFKKNKEKVYENFQEKSKKQETKKQESESKPEKRLKLNTIQNSINITIQPEPVKNKQINEQDIQNELRKIKQTQIHDFGKMITQQSKPIKGSLKRQQDRRLDSSDQDSSGLDEGINPDSIAKQLDFEFDQKFRLKSNDDLNAIIAGLPKDKFESEFDGYMKDDKADSQQFEHYVYYKSEESDENINGKNQQKTQTIILSKNKGLKQQGMFKLISVPSVLQDKSQIYDHADSFESSNNSKVIKIDQDDINHLQSNQDEKFTQKRTIQQTGLMKSPQISQQKLDDSLSQDDKNSLIELQLRKGFESNLFFIKEYCISLCQYIRDNAQVKDQFKNIISQPLQFSTEDLLKKYRLNAQGAYNDTYNSLIAPLQYKKEFRKPPVKAISTQLSKEFNKTYGPLKFWNVDLNNKGRSKFQMQKQTEAIFLSAILQVLNESLDFQRPGSIFGKPLPWANKSKHLKNMKYLNGQKTKRLSQDSDESAQTYDFIFGVAIARIIQWGSCLCGFLPDTAELQNTQIEDDYVVHIRETRMAFLLQKMLAEEEATFNNSQLEQTQVMLYLGKAIYEQLIEQTTKQFSSIINLSFNQN